MESLVSVYPNLVICKSMSKCYALSGLRVAYLASQKSEYLKKYIPPWSVSLPAQLAAIHALKNPTYYIENYRIIHSERKMMSNELSNIGFTVYSGVANYILTLLPENTNFTSKSFIEACRDKKLLVRYAQNMDMTLTDKSVRFDIRSPKENKEMFKIVTQIIN